MTSKQKTKKFGLITNVSGLLPSQWTDYDDVKMILRKHKFKINDDTNDIEGPKNKVALTWDDVIELEKALMCFIDYERMEIEVRLK